MLGNQKSLVLRNMAEMQQQAIGGLDLIPRRSFQGNILETFQHVAKGSDPAPKRALLKARSGITAMANSDMQEALSPPPYHLTQIRPLEGHETQCLGSHMSTNMRDEAIQKTCVTTPRQMRAKPMVVGTWQTDFLMAMGM